MDTPVRDSYVQRIEAELRGNILPFWIRHAVDREHGGFHGEISNDLRVRPGVERGALLTSRILWTYSAALQALGDPALREMAEWAYRDLMTRFHDRANGGFFWSASEDGKPLRTRKQIYGQAFAIYALSEFHRATGQADALRWAIEVFRKLEAHCRDRRHGGYFEAYTKDWVLEQDVRLSEIDLNEPKSQNTHLHVMEAYTNLLRVWPDGGLRQAQRDLLDVMTDRILDGRTHHLGLFFDVEWRPRSDRISFGHDIEAAWLMTEAAETVGDAPRVEKIRGIAVEIARVTHDEGLDPDGSLLYEAGPEGYTQTHKEWWPQAEAAVGFLNAYQISGDKRYLHDALRLWDYIEAHLVDRRHGEWFRAVDRNGLGTDDSAKVSFWKCPYHNGRACLELMVRLKSL